MVQRVLAAMAMLPARTWVRVPPTTSGVFLRPGDFSPVTRVLHSTIESQRQHLCHVPQLSSLRLSGVACKTNMQAASLIFAGQLSLMLGQLSSWPMKQATCSIELHQKTINTVQPQLINTRLANRLSYSIMKLHSAL